jgi:3-oxoacyl-[acyl-carrier-protein] synthase III
MYSYIHSIEYHLPDFQLTNDLLSKVYKDWSSTKIEKKTGIQTRHIAAAGECASDLGVVAAQKIFNDFDKKRVDYLIFCSESPDYLLPPTACLIQDRLGLRNDVGALDINLGCSGFVYGLGLSKALIATRQATNVLLITAETYSKYIHPNDKSVRAIFGDGAAATLISATCEKDFLGQFIYGTDGSGFKNLIIPSGVTRKNQDFSFFEEQNDTRTPDNIYMNGPEIFNFTIKTVPSAVKQILIKSNLLIEEIDLFVFHQANAYMLNHLRNKISIPSDRFYINLSKCGNTVSATIPIALRMAIEEGKVHKGQKIMLVGFGVGYSWAACVIDWA